MNVTVVTAYYEIPSKFPSTKYWEWIENFCKIPCDLVLFTSSNLVEKFKKLRQHSKNTKIVSLEFEKLYHYKFLKEYKIEKTKDYVQTHSPELYIIWAEKVKFVRKAIEMNFFNTDTYVWCDIGVFRQIQFLNIFKSFPKYENIVKNKMNFLQLKTFQKQDFIKDKFELVGQPYGTVRLGGGIHGGTVDVWKTYEKMWDDTLQRYFNSNRFSGQDQCVMGTIYIEHPDLFHLVVPQYYGGDEWFYLLYHWSV